jgi:hypothetical protein
VEICTSPKFSVAEFEKSLPLESFPPLVGQEIAKAMETPALSTRYLFIICGTFVEQKITFISMTNIMSGNILSPPDMRPRLQEMLDKDFMAMTDRLYLQCFKNQLVLLFPNPRIACLSGITATVESVSFHFPRQSLPPLLGVIPLATLETEDQQFRQVCWLPTVCGLTPTKEFISLTAEITGFDSLTRMDLFPLLLAVAMRMETVYLPMPLP